MIVLKFFDFFSQAPSVKINGSDRLNTIFGSIIGLFTTIIFIFGIFFIFNDYISRLSYKLNSYTDNSVKPDMDPSKFRMGFLVIDVEGNQFPERERLFTLKALHWDIYIPSLGANSTQSVKIENIPVKRCTDLNHTLYEFETLKDLSRNYDTDCLDFENVNKNLSGVFNNFGR